ncbi:JmjC domain-containing protein [Actinoplanes sp. N902-109]|uniref:JmjC domain-containing protein n=1 Tax=Actinoplanes sp. (strain N902-109) TaxID=649831 RepID=UPI00032956BD|nr:cupin domain-containing protein [Actinoplanes sp. N902-109]AGL19152.1 cupin 4 family protein [Actinoplanes sp. N902-109]
MSSSTLAGWVGDPDAFLSSYWGREPAVFRPAQPAVSSFTLADADAAIAGGFLRYPYVEMLRAEDSLDRNSYLTSRRIYASTLTGFADEAKIETLLKDGATLLLRCIDQWHNPTAALTRKLAEELGRAVEAFFFVTPAGHQGLPLHRDDADVLVVQVAGRKSWHVHEGPASGTWQAGVVGAGEEPAEVLATTIEAGEVLYIPRGYAHRATGDGGLSTHLSLTIRDAGTDDLSTAAHAFATAGAGLPPRPLGDEELLQTARELIDHLCARLGALQPEDLVQLARRRRIDEMPGVRPALSLTDIAEQAMAMR